MNYLLHVYDINDITRNRNMAKCNMKGKLLDSFTSFFNNKFYKIDKTSVCKGNLNLKWIYEDIDFQNSNENIVRISASKDIIWQIS